MKIRINEVWNAEGKSKEIAVIDIKGNPYGAVSRWIEANRPDLNFARDIYSHGYHAEQIYSQPPNYEAQAKYDDENRY